MLGSPIEIRQTISRRLEYSTTKVIRRYAILPKEMSYAAMEKSPLDEEVEEEPLWYGNSIRLCELKP